MLNTKKLIDITRKSQKLSAAFGRRASLSSLRRRESAADDDQICSTGSSALASKGHLFVYTVEGKRFMVPIEYLNTNIFRELLKISEEEFGLRHEGPIILHCDATYLRYIISLLDSRVSRDVERVLHTTISNQSRCIDLFSDHLGQGFDQQPILCRV